MSVASVLRRTGNKAYEYAFPIYRPLYGAYKAYGDRAERQLLKKILFPGAIVVDAGRISVFIPSSCHIVLVLVESSLASNLLQRISCDCVWRRASCQMYTSARQWLENAVARARSIFPISSKLKRPKRDGVPVPVPRDGTRDPPIKTPCRGSRLPRNRIATAGVGCVLVKAFAGGTPASTNKNALSDFSDRAF